VTVGLWRGKKDLKALQKKDRIFIPQMNVHHREKLYAGWQRAVTQARTT